MDTWNPLTTEQYIAKVLGEELEAIEKKEAYNSVSKPRHYMLFEKEGIEVRDVIEKLTEKFELTSMGHSYMFAADYVQMMQYLMRFMDKNGKEDLEKARWYLDKLIEAY
jgi:hypothetical protein